MAYADNARSLPPVTALLAGIIAAVAVPGLLILLYFKVVGGLDAVGAITDMLTFLGIAIGQALAIAIPLGLYHWSKSKRPLRDCVLIGAVSAPGPLGYLGLTLALSGNAAWALVIWAVLGGLGALGGACFYWAATWAASSGRS